MALIYEPKGPAREYAARACNLYKGCGHHCLYCYGPYFAYQCMDQKIAKEKFDEPTIRGKEAHTEEKRMEILLKNLKNEAEKYSNGHRVLMSFTSDAYQPREKDTLLTQNAIKIMGEAGVPMTILTKNKMAVRDIDLFVKYGIDFATTICFLDESMREKYEPDASTIEERLETLKTMRDAGLRTWVSLEPTIDTKEGLKVVNRLIGNTDLIKIGTVDRRWDPGIYDNIDWTQYLEDVLNTVEGNNDYYIKDGLWKFATNKIKSQHQKEHKKIIVD